MDFQGSPASRKINPQASPDGIPLQQIVTELKNEMDQCRSQMPDPTSRHSITRFPDFLSGMAQGIQLREPKLASIGPYYKRKENLLPFQSHKTNFRRNFLQRRSPIRILDDLRKTLIYLEDSIRDCYTEDTKKIKSEDFVEMMLTDGSFIVELFHQSAEDLDATWPWFSELNTLTADLLKMGNQLPFFVLETLFHSSSSSINQATSNQALRNQALRFFNRALGRPLDMVFQNKQQPTHLLDLFRSSLLPVSPPRNNCEAFLESIQCAEMLCKAGITLRRKRADSFLEIDFRKLQIPFPPFALRIPPVAIDDLTSTILVNCVALEQCLHNASKHFTAYIRFMNCLVRQTEDVQILRTANIIRRIEPNSDEHVMQLLDSFRGKVHLNARESYLWKQYKEIDSYYDNPIAYICSNLTWFNALTLVVSILGAVIALCSWLFPKQYRGHTR